MRKLFLFGLSLLVVNGVSAENESTEGRTRNSEMPVKKKLTAKQYDLINYEKRTKDFKQLVETGKCRGCDLSFFDLRSAINELNRLKKSIDIENTDLKGSNLSNTNLRYANLRGVRADSSNFDGANLDSANMKNFKAKQARFRGANFTAANMQNAEIVESDIVDSTFEDANVAGAFFVLVTENGGLDYWERIKKPDVERMVLARLMEAKGLESARFELIDRGGNGRPLSEKACFEYLWQS